MSVNIIRAAVTVKIFRSIRKSLTTPVIIVNANSNKYGNDEISALSLELNPKISFKYFGK